MGKNIITGSLVVYHNSKEDIKKVIDSFLGYKSDSILIVVDNSLDNSLSDLFTHDRIIYLYNNANVGFGAAHNIAFKEAFKLNSYYHILLNPDVHFNPSIIEHLLIKADSDSSIGLIMPKIKYPDGSIQYLCKLIPTPKDLLLRRFIPIKVFKARLEYRYELKFLSYNKEVEIPIVSGCFMFIRTSILQNIGGFDTRYFMYLEDVDLCRRVGELSKVLYYPEVEVTHNYEKGSYKNKKLLFYHIKSAIKYFNKWGWINDKKRKEINTRTLNKLNFKKYKNL
jgi:GT2 family glycosyltransferase